MQKLREITELEQESEKAFCAARKEKEEVEQYYEMLFLAENTEEKEEEVKEKLDSLRRASGYLRRAYLQSMSATDELSARWRELQKSRKKKRFFALPANGVIDREEREQNHFAKGMNIYKILILCYLGSFFGVILEMIWSYLKFGVWESRANLVYGPFNLVYGAGVVALSVCLYGFRNHRRWVSFVGGFFIGSVLEYLCSWGQEIMFGASSWDYSGKPFNINGRICLLYSLFWGFLGVFWMKNIYPRLAKWILKIPNRIGKITTWVLLVFFAFNSVVSIVASYRWSERVKNVEPSNAFWEFIDDRFPDERMERIFANLKFKE